MAGVQLKVRLSEELVARVDAVRGPASRPAWVAWLVERELGAVGGGSREAMFSETSAGERAAAVAEGRVLGERLGGSPVPSGPPVGAGLSPGQARAASFRRATQ